jgi:hypothetical protein
MTSLSDRLAEICCDAEFPLVRIIGLSESGITCTIKCPFKCSNCVHYHGTVGLGTRLSHCIDGPGKGRSYYIATPEPGDIPKLKRKEKARHCVKQCEPE